MLQPMTLDVVVVVVVVELVVLVSMAVFHQQRLYLDLRIVLKKKKK